MTIPQMTRALTLEHRVQTPDGAGGFTSDWQALGVVWAAIKPGAGRESAALSASLSRMAYQITLRAAPDGAPSRPQPGQRFRQGARLYTIAAVADADAKGLYLTCFATEEMAT
jgi:SPP1 family predicted phage head-tail adaptor